MITNWGKAVLFFQPLITPVNSFLHRGEIINTLHGRLRIEMPVILLLGSAFLKTNHSRYRVTSWKLELSNIQYVPATPATGLPCNCSSNFILSGTPFQDAASALALHLFNKMETFFCDSSSSFFLSPPFGTVTVTADPGYSRLKVQLSLQHHC